MTGACMGGTFDPIHRGHRRLLAAAFEAADHVFIGVTDDRMARAKRRRRVASAAVRLRRLERYLDAAGYAGRAEAALIHDPVGRAYEARFDMIVVSEETTRTAARINAERAKKKLPPLAVVRVPFVLGLDGRPISGTRVARGEIDPDGVRPRRIVAAAGTANRSKTLGMRRALLRFAPSVQVVPVKVRHATPEQPYDAETVDGAVARARAALAADERAGLGIGVEAGIVRDDPSGSWLDVQYAAIADRAGRITIGHGPGFAYPPAVLERLRDDWSVGRAVGDLSGKPGIGNAEGAIGWLTRGRADRAELTEWAVLSALVPRLRPELYDQ